MAAISLTMIARRLEHSLSPRGRATARAPRRAASTPQKVTATCSDESDQPKGSSRPQRSLSQAGPEQKGAEASGLAQFGQTPSHEAKPFSANVVFPDLLFDDGVAGSQL